jgi:ankyrin repeat protein
MRLILLNDLNSIKILIYIGANINSKDKSLNTPLILAAFEGKKEIVKLLLNSGADPNLKDEHNRDAIYWAEKKGYKDIVNLIQERFKSLKRVE